MGCFNQPQDIKAEIALVITADRLLGDGVALSLYSARKTGVVEDRPGICIFFTTKDTKDTKKRIEIIVKAFLCVLVFPSCSSWLALIYSPSSKD